MRTRESMLAYEVKKNPVLADIYSNLSTVTFEDIENLKVIKWIKQELTNKKRRDYVKSIMVVKDYVVEDQYGSVKRYERFDDFITVDRGGSVEIKSGKLLFFPENGGVWIDTLFSKYIDPILYDTSLLTTRCSRTEYIRQYKDEQLRMYDHAPVLFTLGDDSNKSSSPASPMQELATKFKGVRFG